MRALFARDPRIEASLLKRRDDVREWAVYADWLEANGSPRGALAALMMRREMTPTFEMAEALKAHEELFGDLTPESMKTLETRGYPRLAPVFRRGFIHSAGANDALDFRMLIEHPSCALLDTVVLEPDTDDDFALWLTSLESALPWRRVEVNFNAQGAVSLSKLFEHTPRLQHLTLSLNNDVELELKGMGCESVTFKGASSQMLRSLIPFKEQKLRRLEVSLALNEYDEREVVELDALVGALAPLWKRLDEVVLEGTIGEVTRRACLAGARPKKVVVRTPPPVVDAFAVSLESDETSFAVFSRELTAADEKTITQYARLAGVSRLVLHTRVVMFGLRPMTLLRLHGTGEAPLVARVVAQQLVKTDRALDAMSLTLSVSNDVVSAWSFGPHVAKPDAAGRKTIPISRRDESCFTRHQVVRELCEALAGFDPGLDVLDELIAALDTAEVRTLIGEPPAPGEQVPLFTDFTKDEPVEDDEDGFDDDDDDDPDYAEYDRRDALAHQVGYEVGERDTHAAAEEFEWGATPESDPDFGAATMAVTVPVAEKPVVIGASLLPTANAEDDEPDEDDRTHDAWSADAEEVWLQGPVDLPEHHRGPVGEVFDELLEPADFPLGSYVPDTMACVRCSQVRETARCSVCRDDVCRECAGVKSLAAFDDGRDFSCAQCTPRTSGRFVAVRPRAR